MGTGFGGGGGGGGGGARSALFVRSACGQLEEAKLTLEAAAAVAAAAIGVLCVAGADVCNGCAFVNELMREFQSCLSIAKLNH